MVPARRVVRPQSYVLWRRTVWHRPISNNVSVECAACIFRMVAAGTNGT
jgi:hypothetical protein